MSSNFKIIEVHMTSTSPLFTGEVRVQEKKAAQQSRINFPVRKTAQNKVLVPFKGALRSSLEIMLKSKGEPVCDTGQSGSRPCGRCDLCSMFGSMGKKGRINTDFLISEEDKSKIVHEATHIRIDREKGSTSDSFTGEEVIEGAVFTGRIFISNPTDKDVKYIKSALSYIEEHGLGGWTNKGYGRVKFEIAEQSITKESYIK